MWRERTQHVSLLVVGELDEVVVVEPHGEARLPDVELPRRQVEDVRHQLGEEGDRHKLELKVPPEYVPLLHAARVQRLRPDLRKHGCIRIVIGEQSGKDDLRRGALERAGVRSQITA